jgi:ParB family chromosome partitioning protein
VTPVPAMIALDLLRPCPAVPRRTHAPAHLDRLAASVAELGIVEPIVVRPAGGHPVFAGGRWDGMEWFEVVAGAARCLAAERAGLTRVPATIRMLTDEAAKRLARATNLKRGTRNRKRRAKA